MIELELKYELKSFPDVFKTLEVNKEKEQNDVYYDSRDYKLLSSGNFLRVRNGKRIDFKLDIKDDSHLFCEELSFNANQINEKSEAINLALKMVGIFNEATYDNVNEFINKNNLEILAIINKKRKEYKISDVITIALDSVDKIGVFVEAEIMIDKDWISKEDSTFYKNKLLETLNKLNIFRDNPIECEYGYVEMYLKKYNTEAFYLGKFQGK